MKRRKYQPKVKAQQPDCTVDPSRVSQMVPFRDACIDVGILPTHLTQLVKSGKVYGRLGDRVVSITSLEAYMATR